MMSETSGEAELVGDKVRADGWYGASSGLQTISISVSNFRGKIIIQGTLHSVPSDDDWFPVLLNDKMEYVKYPRIENDPTGHFNGDTRTEGFDVTGNFTFLRAILDRTHLKPLPSNKNDIARYGSISRILLYR